MLKTNRKIENSYKNEHVIKKKWGGSRRKHYASCKKDIQYLPEGGGVNNFFKNIPKAKVVVIPIAPTNSIKFVKKEGKRGINRRRESL